MAPTMRVNRFTQIAAVRPGANSADDSAAMSSSSTMALTSVSEGAFCIHQTPARKNCAEGDSSSPLKRPYYGRSRSACDGELKRKRPRFISLLQSR